VVSAIVAASLVRAAPVVLQRQVLRHGDYWMCVDEECWGLDGDGAVVRWAGCGDVM
jgi:hypothetical protein